MGHEACPHGEKFQPRKTAQNLVRFSVACIRFSWLNSFINHIITYLVGFFNLIFAITALLECSAEVILNVSDGATEHRTFFCNTNKIEVRVNLPIPLMTSSHRLSHAKTIFSP